MLEIYFLARHTPFWAVPLIILGTEFAYVSWLKKKKKTAGFCLSIAMIGALSIGFYVWAGGPEQSVKQMRNFLRSVE